MFSSSFVFTGDRTEGCRRKDSGSVLETKDNAFLSSAESVTKNRKEDNFSQHKPIHSITDAFLPLSSLSNATVPERKLRSPITNKNVSSYSVILNEFIRNFISLNNDGIPVKNN